MKEEDGTGNLRPGRKDVKVRGRPKNWGKLHKSGRGETALEGRKMKMDKELRKDLKEEEKEMGGEREEGE